MKKLWIFLTALLVLLGGTGCKAEAERTEKLAFSYRGTQIALHGEAAPILEALGEPKSYTEEPSCAFDGLDKTYFFGSFYLSTYPLEGKDYISGIWFADDSITTDGGICLGSSREAVEKAYGADCFNGISAYIITQEGDTLTIILTDNQVSSIQYAAGLT